jgi:hypothetical protein
MKLFAHFIDEILIVANIRSDLLNLEVRQQLRTQIFSIIVT